MIPRGYDAEVLVVGAGPTGLLLALRCARLGLSVRVLERDARPAMRSRAIGIQPPALERLAAAGLLGSFLDAGVAVARGVAFGRSGARLGALDFVETGWPLPWVLSCPQQRTERILADAVVHAAPGALQRGAGVVAVREHDDGVTALCRALDGRERAVRGRFLVGCDGKRSTVREQIGARFPGGREEESFVMLETADTTGFGPTAALFLHRDGVVECFPLSGHGRRWVMRTPGFVREPTPELVGGIVRRRTGHLLPATHPSLLSSFGAEAYLAAPFGRGRVLLAGDAAHIVTPIGGQGMNLGWLDAWSAAGALRRVLRDGAFFPEVFAAWATRRRRAAELAIRRGRLNMALGRGGRAAPARDLLVRGLLRSPARPALARLFTMSGLS
jgi:2-polyprenyl-6-methoxyphenol hydroxylase-like FAD-dependent oxidoreductase